MRKPKFILSIFAIVFLSASSCSRITNGSAVANLNASLTGKVAASPTPSPTPTVYFLSSLIAAQNTTSWGPMELDTSNGENVAGDGHTITLNGVTYVKGLGVAAASDVKYNLTGLCSTFQAVVGVDDEVGSNGSVIFKVLADGVLLFQSALLTGNSAGIPVNVNVTGKLSLELVVTDGGDGNAFDHADWADAKVTCISKPVSPDTVAPTASITAPTETAYSTAQSVTIQASAADAYGVSKVELYEDNVLKSTWTTSPYNYSWSFTNLDNGVHSWAAKAYDASGNIGLSPPLNINISIPVPGVASPTQSADRFVDSMGVATHLNYTDLAPYGAAWNGNTKLKLTALGMRHIRDGISNWPATDLEFQDLADNYGIKATAVCGIAGGNPDDASSCLTYADQIGSGLEAFEGANELDNNDVSWTTDYARFQYALYNAVKSSIKYASYPVLSSSMSNSASSSQIKTTMLPAGNFLSDFMDFGNMHAYPITGTPTNGLPQTIGNYQRYISGSKPQIVTETGFHNAINHASCLNWWPGVSEATGGKYAPRFYLEYFNAGVYRTFLYELADEHVEAPLNCNEDHFGLLRNDSSAKPAYTALANLITLLTDPGASFSPRTLRYSLAGMTNVIHKTLLAKRDGRVYLILWQDALSYNTTTLSDIAVATIAVTVNLTDSFSQAKTYLPLNSTVATTTIASPVSFVVQVPDHPIVIELLP